MSSWIKVKLCTSSTATAAGSTFSGFPPTASAASNNADGRSLFPPASRRCRIALYKSSGGVIGRNLGIDSSTNFAFFWRISSIMNQKPQSENDFFQNTSYYHFLSISHNMDSITEMISCFLCKLHIMRMHYHVTVRWDNLFWIYKTKEFPVIFLRSMPGYVNIFINASTRHFQFYLKYMPVRHGHGAWDRVC